MRYPREEGHDHAEGCAIGEENSGGLGRLRVGGGMFLSEKFSILEFIPGLVGVFHVCFISKRGKFCESLA